MIRRIAVKRLTPSDLTFFEWQFRNNPAGNQKSINLNADVFANQLYPGLANSVLRTSGRLPITLKLYGPGGLGLLSLQRKIIKGNAYKNWRLNGEFVHNPEEAPDRFNRLEAGDFVVLEFHGEPHPETIQSFFIAKNARGDRKLHEYLAVGLGERSMLRLSPSQLQSIVHNAAPPSEHPIRLLLLEETIDNAAMGDAEATGQLQREAVLRQISREDLRQAKARAEDIGLLGELHVNGYLEELFSKGCLKSVQWTAVDYAVAPYDFEVVEEDVVRIEVKTTTGPFDRRIHISAAELATMAANDPPCELYRVYEANADEAKLKIARSTNSQARKILDSVQGLPEGVRMDSVSVDPKLFDFSDTIAIGPALEDS